MEKKRFTLETVMAWGPCYTREKIAEWFAGRDSLTVADCLALPISDEDKLWCLLHPEVIPESRLHELACQYAERALVRERAAGREPDPRSWAAIKAKRLWICGKIDDAELARAGAEASSRAAASSRAGAAEAAWATAAWARAAARAAVATTAVARAVARAAATTAVVARAAAAREEIALQLDAAIKAANWRKAVR